MKKSRSDIHLQTTALPQQEIPKFSTRSRIAARSLQIVSTLITLVLLSKFDSDFLSNRDLRATWASTVWISWISMVLALMLMLYPYIPKVIQSYPLAYLHGGELILSITFSLVFFILFIALIITTTGTSSRLPCTPGTQKGQCDMLNSSIVFVFINVCTWGYSSFRSYYDWRKKGHSGRTHSISSLIRMNERSKS